MNNHNKLLLTTIAAVGIIGLVGSTFASRFAGPTRMSDATDQEDSPQERSFRVQERSTQGDLGELFFEQSFEGMDALEVEMGDADVILEESRGGRVTVAFWVDGRGKDNSAWARDIFERMEFQAEASGRALFVEAHEPRVERREWRDGRGFSATVVIGVPQDLEITVRTADGDISAERLSGPASLSSADGDIEIGVAEGEFLELETADGDILVDRLSADVARISTGDGDILLDEVRSALAVSTGDGDVRITFGEAHEAEVTTGDGDVTIFAPSTLRATFRLEGEDLNIAPGMELRGRLRGHMISGDLNGGGPQIDVRTGDGTVTLRSSN